MVWVVGFGVVGSFGAAAGVRRVQGYVLDDWHFRQSLIGELKVAPQTKFGGTLIGGTERNPNPRKERKARALREVWDQVP